MSTPKYIPWPVGILLAPVLIVGVALVAAFTGVVIAGCALTGRLKWEPEK